MKAEKAWEHDSKKTNLREKEKACLENTFCLSLVSMPAASSLSLL